MDGRGLTGDDQKTINDKMGQDTRSHAVFGSSPRADFRQLNLQNATLAGATVRDFGC